MINAQHKPACELCGQTYDILELDSRGFCLVCVAEHKFLVDLEALGDKRGRFVVALSSVGNPDFRQDPRRALPGVPKKKLRVTSLLNASKACRLYIAFYELGSGNWAGGEVVDRKTKQAVAFISYNGRAWRERGSVEHPIDLGGAS